MIVGTHGLIASQITQFVGLLDLYPSASAAYSLRKLRGGYSGNAIRVRRTNLDEMNIGFTALGELDTTALLTFTGTGALDNGFVTTWYDQSGNGRNATQSTAINQPQIVNAGSVNLENGKPAIRFGQVNPSNLRNTSSFDYQTTFTVTRFITRPSFAYILTNIGKNAKILSDVNGSGYRLFNGANLYVGTNPSLINQDLIYGLFNGASSQIAVDGNTATVGNPGTAVNSGIQIGTADNDILSSINGNIQEIVLYNSNQSDNKTAIETNINSFYSIY